MEFFHVNRMVKENKDVGHHQPVIPHEQIFCFRVVPGKTTKETKEAAKDVANSIHKINFRSINHPILLYVS